MKKTINQIAAEDGRYDVRALKFIYEGLGETIRKIRRAEASEDEPCHITGGQLAKGLGKLATKRWGLMAKTVLNYWGVKTTRDMGEIVYLMIANKWMTAQEADSIEDFDNIFDFENVFEKQFKLEIK